MGVDWCQMSQLNRPRVYYLTTFYLDSTESCGYQPGRERTIATATLCCRPSSCAGTRLPNGRSGHVPTASQVGCRWRAQCVASWDSAWWPVWCHVWKITPHVIFWSKCPILWQVGRFCGYVTKGINVMENQERVTMGLMVPPIFLVGRCVATRSHVVG